MKNFREMNQARIGLAGVAVIVVGLIVLFNLTQFPFLTGATTYRAAFADAAGLQTGDKVRLAGASVGKIRGIDLDGNQVVVSFDVTESGVHLGSQTSAAIKTETVLGRKFLQVTSAGTGELDSDGVIPLARTSTPYNITHQLGRLTSTTGQIDTAQLARSFDAISEAFKDAPPQLRAALDGLTRLSQTISSRDGSIQSLLGNAEGVTGILADRNQQLTRLVVDGNDLLGELAQRRTAIQQLLVNVQSVATQLSGLVHDNEAQLQPTLQRLNSVLDVLRRNDGNIAVALQRIGPFASSLGESVASGPFFSAYIQNLIPGNLIPLPNVLGARNQAPGGSK
ncbi:MCE family protein [Amycolatopsis acidicola]|uniref:MCE family protein n=1 Tax=Amycolatopsis acidicola TaxID=2596893 RepID=A0A5N0V5U7_9PSEU|nr:MCE family protein [Amycolatopsis acidicola]KAA9160483.1 MCE family protein [Amycolatopsis acidicola]